MNIYCGFIRLGPSAPLLEVERAGLVFRAVLEGKPVLLVIGLFQERLLFSGAGQDIILLLREKLELELLLLDEVHELLLLLLEDGVREGEERVLLEVGGYDNAVLVGQSEHVLGRVFRVHHGRVIEVAYERPREHPADLLLVHHLRVELRVELELLLLREGAIGREIRLPVRTLAAAGLLVQQNLLLSGGRALELLALRRRLLRGLVLLELLLDLGLRLFLLDEVADMVHGTQPLVGEIVLNPLAANLLDLVEVLAQLRERLPEGRVNRDHERDEVDDPGVNLFLPERLEDDRAEVLRE